MVLIQAILAAIFRSAGRLLNTVFGWATGMLFGRVPQDRQIYLSLISFGSVAWLIALVGIAFPKIGTFLLSFVPLPDWVDRKWVRLAMLAAALIIPPFVGALSIRMVDPKDRPRWVRGTLAAIARGYPYTVGLALTLVLMTLFAPFLKLRNLARRWTTQHVPVIVDPADYPAVVDDLDMALRRSGFVMARGRPSWMLRAPTRLLGWFAGAVVGELVADQLTRLYAPDLEVILHPSDMVISGRPTTAARARAAIAAQLPFTRAYLTWDAEANEIEDALRRVWHSVEGGAGHDALARLRALETRMDRLTLPYEEWEVLFRQKLQVERAALRRIAGLADDASTGIGVERADAPLRRTLEAVADAVDAFRRSWRAERRGRGLGLVPFLATAAVLSAALAGNRRSGARTSPADLPAPDAHSEARLPKAA
ncbi:MAG TPA: hypothetical protein VGQ77_15345 [Methylomirabilota bacterium]|nr:hypothetical protein [Methylomirabilota bacterium]